jgi:histidine triad (HIT) family protein
MASDIFCKIAAGEIPSKTVYRDEDIVAIEDINPQAPSHVLVMPTAHYANLAELTASGNRELLAKLMQTAADIGRRIGGDDGFRLVVNTGPDGGQTVEHLHVHVLAGRPMTWPPG